MFDCCTCCGCLCKVNRNLGKLGVCHTGAQARVSSFGPHPGEEEVLSGWRGSGTIFFSRCNLRCQFCQNHEISQADAGNEVSAQELAAMMLSLQAMGCHNINLVSPTHGIAPIIEAVALAARQGLRLPLVYNTGGYDSVEGLRLLDGVVDIYMPDMKYSNAQTALRYSKVARYPEVNHAALREMHRQVGDLVLDERGLAQRGLLVRHLVLPNGLAGSAEIMHFLAEEISRDTYVNIMAQYHPAYRAREYSSLNKRVKAEEVEEAKRLAREAGLRRIC
jgi:putative pyruvate formate lyase activating enzyme